MPRIRTIKPQFWDDIKISKVCRDARLTFIAMWNFADDNGVIIADTIWLKSKVFPYDSIQVQQFEKWVNELKQIGFIIPFSFKKEEFYYLPNFAKHQVINKPNNSGCFIPKESLEALLVLPHSDSVIATVALPYQSGVEKEGNRKGMEESKDSPQQAANVDINSIYKDVDTSDVKSLSDFIKAYSPKFHDPYWRCWNLFAKKYKIASVKVMNTKRIKSLNVRLQDSQFDFLEILKKASKSPFILENTWFTFDWLVKNDNNYLKVIEGNYDKKGPVASTEPAVNQQVLETKKLLEEKTANQ